LFALAIGNDTSPVSDPTDTIHSPQIVCLWSVTNW